jgi:hypothetical protein
MRSSKSASKLSQVVDQAKEQAADLGERVGPALDEARERLVPMVEDARDRFVPLAEKAAQDAREAAQQAAERARPHATAAKVAATAATAKGARKVATALDERLPDERTPAVISKASERKKGGKIKKLLVLAGLGGAAAYVAKRMTSEPAPTWQSVPPPAPTSSSGGSSGPSGETTDAAGASPDEVAADRAEEPHEPTSPDNPAEEVDLTKK